MKSGTQVIVIGLGLMDAFVFVGGSGAGTGPALLLAVLCLVGGLLYFLPAIIAFEREHPNAVAVCLVDLFLGWSLIGWVGALVWSLVRDRTAELLEAQARGRAAGAGAPIAAPAAATKLCPYCAEQVLVAAIKCKHCGSELSGPRATT